MEALFLCMSIVMRRGIREARLTNSGWCANAASSTMSRTPKIGFATTVEAMMILSWSLSLTGLLNYIDSWAASPDAADLDFS